MDRLVGLYKIYLFSLDKKITRNEIIAEAIKGYLKNDVGFVEFLKNRINDREFTGLYQMLTSEDPKN